MPSEVLVNQGSWTYAKQEGSLYLLRKTALSLSGGIILFPLKFKAGPNSRRAPPNLFNSHSFLIHILFAQFIYLVMKVISYDWLDRSSMPHRITILGKSSLFMSVVQICYWQHKFCLRKTFSCFHERMSS